MCGLLVYFASRGCAGMRADEVRRALESLQHRGPDETGTQTVDEDVVFGHKRLSIIDVDSSHEPLPYEQGRYLLTFNGEIYNYVELREELVREHGARFDTAGDAEVIVAAYRYWGEEAVHRLRGMFAFVSGTGELYPWARQILAMCSASGTRSSSNARWTHGR